MDATVATGAAAIMAIRVLLVSDPQTQFDGLFADLFLHVPYFFAS